MEIYLYIACSWRSIPGRLQDKIRTNLWLLNINIPFTSESSIKTTYTTNGDNGHNMTSESHLNFDENLHKAFVHALPCVGRRPGQSVC